MLYFFDRLFPTKIRNPASYPEAGYLLIFAHNARPFWLKVKANIKRADTIS